MISVVLYLLTAEKTFILKSKMELKSNAKSHFKRSNQFCILKLMLKELDFIILLGINMKELFIFSTHIKLSSSIV